MIIFLVLKCYNKRNLRVILIYEISSVSCIYEEEFCLKHLIAISSFFLKTQNYFLSSSNCSLPIKEKKILISIVQTELCVLQFPESFILWSKHGEIKKRKKTSVPALEQEITKRFSWSASARYAVAIAEFKSVARH